MNEPITGRGRRWLFALLLACTALYAALPSLAAVPHEDAKPAYAEEQTILQQEQGLARPGWLSRDSGIAHLDRHTVVEPGRMGEYGVILQRGGNSWRWLRNQPLAWAAAVLIVLAAVALAAFHWFVGPTQVDVARADEPPVLRFNRLQRWVHWVAAIAFVVLAVTGLVILYGKNLLLPLLGHDAFAAVALASKWLHNVAGPLFVVASLVMFLVYWRDNRFERADAAWLLRLGGLFSHQHVPAPYFNAGEKLWFWFGVTLLGLLVGASGLVLAFPYLGEVGAVTSFTRYQLQIAQVLHLSAAAVYLAVALGHIYLGTLGSPGAWRAMRHGHVDAAWARAHHRIWYERVQRDAAQAPPRRS